MKKVGVNHELVERCVKESFVSGPSGVDNRILADDATWARSQGAFIHPSVSINNVTYRGALNGYDLFRAVCAGFKDQPAVCKGDKIFNQVKQLDSESTTEGHGGKGVPAKATTVALAIVAVMLINFLALYLYRRHHR
jgi:hypothetical protein